MHFSQLDLTLSLVNCETNVRTFASFYILGHVLTGKVEEGALNA